MTQLSYRNLINVTPEAVRDINHLIRQMSRDPRQMDEPYLQRVIDNPGCLLAVWDGERIVAYAQLCVEVLTTKVKAWLEDVVVDEGYRGQGIAAQLLERAVQEAKAMGCKHINLTSGTDRASAHSLYERNGFVERDSRQFRLNLT
jgi:GNAT superfamily N-acetyltransferase